MPVKLQKESYSGIKQDMNQKGFRLIVLIFAVTIILAFAGSGLYFLGKRGKGATGS